MERFISTLKTLERRNTVYAALPLSQKERERHLLDDAIKMFESEFEAAVLAVLKKHKIKTSKKDIDDFESAVLAILKKHEKPDKK